MDAANQIAFNPAEPRLALNQAPASAAVFALYGAEAHSEPYVGRTPNLRARLERLLTPSAKHPRRLQLAGQVRRIEWRATGSEFESLLAQFQLLSCVYGAKAVERMHLSAPTFLRYYGANRFPRLALTSRPSLREPGWAYGPFASRATAERFLDEALKLFQLRRCTDDLEPNVDHPGCVYSEMKMCLAPCFLGCSDERYTQEANAVQQFVATRAQNQLVELARHRNAASEALEFEQAATLHAQLQKVESVAALLPEIVRPLHQLQALILQPSAVPGHVALFLFADGRLRGPLQFSTLGMRIQNENSGSSSLYAQPMAVEAVVEEALQPEVAPQSQPQSPLQPESQPAPLLPAQATADDSNTDSEQPAEPFAAVSAASARQLKVQRSLLEAQLDDLIHQLQAQAEAPSAAAALLSSLPSASSASQPAFVRQAHLALLKRWYYRPEAKRTGEIFFPAADQSWPNRQILRGIGRVAARALGVS